VCCARVKDGAELVWQREASVDVTYLAGGVEDTFAPEVIRTDQVAIDEASAAVHVGETVIHFADDAYITPGEARRLAAALVELADYAETGDEDLAPWLGEALVHCQVSSSAAMPWPVRSGCRCGRRGRSARGRSSRRRGW
jgi:hypothetical protein